MKFSVSVAMSDPSHYAPLAKAAEELGYHAVVLPDSIFYSEQVSAPYPYTQDGKRMWGPETPWIDPFIAVAHMAAHTSTLFFYTSVLKLAVRDPVLVAKQVGSLAAVTNNRFGLGAGLGWLPEEFKWCGSEYETRGARMDEEIQILKLILGGGMVEFHGKHYDFAKLQMSPAPTKPVPLYLGGHELPGLKRAAKYGDGWSSAMLPSKKLLELVRKLNDLRKEYGRDHLPFEVQGVVTDVFQADGFKRLEAEGVTDIITMPWVLYGFGFGQAPIEKKIEGLRRFAEDVIAKMG